MINNKQYQPLIAPSIFWDKSTLTSTYGECTIQPLEASFGHTIANVLRRLLLGGIESSAVSSVIIEGVNNEFSVIPGVIDDTLMILLRLQQLIIKNTTGNDGIMKIEVNKEGPVYARDIISDDHLSIINPDLLITQLAENAKINMTLFVTSGRGYKKADWTNKKQLQDDNRIFLNVTYSPVKSVAFEVQKTRVGDNIGYDKIILHITTNGSITPNAAIDYSISVLMHQFEKLINSQDFLNFSDKSISITGNIEKINSKHNEDALRIPKLKDNFSPELFLKSIDVLGLPARAHNCLTSAGIERIIDLVNMAEQDIWMLKNFGKKSYDDLVQVMKELGLSFEMGINEKQILKYMEKQV